MATLAELSTLINEGGPFADKVKAAILKTSIAVAFEDPGTTNHANRLALAKSFLSDPNGNYQKVMRYVIAANAAETLVDILALSDATIQSHCDASLAILADGS